MNDEQKKVFTAPADGLFKANSEEIKPIKLIKPKKDEQGNDIIRGYFKWYEGYEGYEDEKK